MFFLDNCNGLAPIVKLIKNGVLPILYVGIGIIIVVLIIIDIAKAIVAGDEKEVKAAQKSAIRRLIYGIAIFFVVVIVNFVFSLLGKAESDEVDELKPTSWYDCWNNPDGVTYQCYQCNGNGNLYHWGSSSPSSSSCNGGWHTVNRTQDACK